MREIYKDIPNYEGLYQVSNLGNVRSLDRKNSKGYPIKGVKMNASKHDHGYLKIELKKNGDAKNFYIHRLVALTFIDNPGNKRMVNHKNGLKHDNDVENLEWVTPKENSTHAIETGLKDHSGEKHPMCKLTECDVGNIRFLLNKGMTAKEIIIKHYHFISVPNVYRIKHGYTWKNVKPNNKFILS